MTDENVSNIKDVDVPFDELTLPERQAIERGMERDVERDERHLAAFRNRTDELTEDGHLDTDKYVLPESYEVNRNGQIVSVKRENLTLEERQTISRDLQQKAENCEKLGEAIRSGA